MSHEDGKNSGFLDKMKSLRVESEKSSSASDIEANLMSMSFIPGNTKP